VSTLALNIIGNPTSAIRALDQVGDKAQKTSGGVHSSFGKLAGSLGGLFAGAGLVSFFKSANDEAVESQKVGAQTTAVLKSTGGAAKVTADQIGDLAGAISNKAGIDDEAIQSGENLLLTFTGIRNEAGKGNDIFNQATSIMTDMSVAMGTDMKSNAIQLGKALNDPAKGMTALTRVGVTFTDQQKHQIETMEKAGNTAGAQKVILGELQREFGGSAAAQATSAQKAQIAFKNLEESVGTALMPVISALANFLTQHVIPVLTVVVAWLQHNSDTIKILAIVLAPLLVAWATYAGVTKVAAMAQAALNAVMAANPIGLVNRSCRRPRRDLHHRVAAQRDLPQDRHRRHARRASGGSGVELAEGQLAVPARDPHWPVRAGRRVHLQALRRDRRLHQGYARQDRQRRLRHVGRHQRRVPRGDQLHHQRLGQPAVRDTPHRHAHPRHRQGRRRVVRRAVHSPARRPAASSPARRWR
jgi:hypothetical protein